MPARLNFDLTLGTPVPDARKLSADEPLRILVMGDFSGAGQRGSAPLTSLAERRIHRLDLDDFDQVLARIGPTVQLAPQSADEPGTEIGFDSLDAFHPDALYRRLDVFAPLRDLRERLRDPARFDQAARELLVSGAAPEPTMGTHASAPTEESAADLTTRLLGAGAASGTAGRTTARLDAVIRRLVEPHLVRDPTAGAGPYLAALDTAAAEAMRAVTGAPGFRQLEASWRSLRTLVDQLDLDETIALFILDVSKDELRADLLVANQPLDGTALYRRLVERLEDSRPAIVIADYEFGATEQDIRLLAALGSIGAHLSAPVIGAAAANLIATPSLAGHTDPRDWTALDGESGEMWQALRSSAIAAWIGLALPRVLLRLPYGARTEAIDSFAFEELRDDADHESYLWGNPAYACALLLGQAFQENGWAMAPGDVHELADLPACIVRGDDGNALKPCAEVLLGERAVDQLLARGLMPLVSYRNRNACRLARFQSIAQPARALAGAWST